MKNSVILFFLGVALLIPTTATTITLPNIVEIKVKTNQPLEKIIIKTDDYVQVRSSFHGNRLVIDIPNAKITKVLKKFKYQSRFIYSIKATQFKNNPYVARITIHFKKEVAYDVASFAGKNKIVVELGDEKALPYHIRHSQSIKQFKQPGSIPYLESKLIVIDPGHGGLDPGGIGYSGTYEKNLTLPVALKLKKLLSRAGAKVILTRRSDKTTNFRKITTYANRIKADLFIAIHFNFYSDPKASGTATYYYNSYSYELARHVQKALVAALHRKNRGIRKDLLYTIHHTELPAILVELLYITNPSEEKLATSSAYQNKMAQALYQGIRAYLKKISR